MDGEPDRSAVLQQGCLGVHRGAARFGVRRLNAAGRFRLPVQVPPGFASVGTDRGPEHSAGGLSPRSIGRWPGRPVSSSVRHRAQHPRDASDANERPAIPIRTALATRGQRTDCVRTVRPERRSRRRPPGNFALDANGVYHTFSGQSGDLANAVSVLFFYDALWDLQYDVDTLHDLRW